MAVSPPVLAEGLAANILEQYAEAERILLERIAKSLAKGIDGPNWAQEKLMEVHAIQARAKKLLSDMESTAKDTVDNAITTAWDRGAAAADRDMIGVLEEALNPDTSRMPGSRAMSRLAAETTDKVIGTHPRILRSTTDIYRSVVAQASSQVLLGTETVRTAAQRALDVFAKKGVTGLIDKAGRGWNMESYVEMAVRTSTAHAAVAGHMDRLQEAGLDLILISNAPAECSRCRPWEGKVLSISGSAVGTEAVATLEEATAAGLFHPNCRHSTALYQPGITKPLKDTEDPQGNADVQKLRDLEREVRERKRVRAVALDPEAARKADLRIRETQAKIREHVNTTTAKRQPAREQLGSGKPATSPIMASTPEPTPTPTPTPIPKTGKATLTGKRFTEDQEEEAYQFSVQQQGHLPYHVLTEAQIAAVPSYQAEGVYDVINPALRNGTAQTAENAKIVRDLDAAIEKASFSQNVITYRGLGDDTGQFATLKVGDTFTDLAYTSTSLNPRIADNFAAGQYVDRGFVLEIQIPRGSRALASDLVSEKSFGESLKDMTNFDLLGASRLNEVTLPRGTTFEVIGRYHQEQGFDVIQVRPKK